ncbi:FtsX-like permease family protein [Bacillus sp. Xin]|uniref:FtsX-like permease family protein n=1 Tax=unclassified Bacillus (in: firmicutes) TaxID=185979 RepID=UPI001572FFD5|nr:MULTISPECIES: FtsX-like permease family protein [unclassified Bacillus (in: firmicutes)]MBC6971616.1 FtsX-like permease family protein [Bacillus sp. Xin]NSW38346.1 FtsX-like permease family protein [Bacillus sp. Xin1]
MSLFRLARKNIQNYAAQRLKQFIWIALSTMLYFFVISIRSNEAVIEKIQHIQFWLVSLYYGEILLFFTCAAVTYQMTKRFLKSRKQELLLYKTVGMQKRKIFWLFCQEQLLICGGAILFGLIHGMLFLKLFTVIFIKLIGVHGINSVPITIYALWVTTMLVSIITLLSIWQCYKFIRNFQREQLYKVEEKA